MRAFIYFLILGLAGFGIFIGFSYYLPDYTRFPASLINAWFIILFFWFFDLVVMKDIDTIEELKKGNTAYAIFLLSLAILFHAAISGS